MNKNGINHNCHIFLMKMAIQTNPDLFEFTVALWELDSTSYFMMHSGGGISDVHYGHRSMFFICFMSLQQMCDIWLTLFWPSTMVELIFSKEISNLSVSMLLEKNEQMFNAEELDFLSQGVGGQKEKYLYRSSYVPCDVWPKKTFNLYWIKTQWYQSFQWTPIVYWNNLPKIYEGVAFSLRST